MDNKELNKMFTRDDRIARREHRRAIKHAETKISIELQDFSVFFRDMSDDVRLEVIKSIIWTAPNMELMWKKVCKVIASEKFGETLD
jgi:hypothetical protein